MHYIMCQNYIKILITSITLFLDIPGKWYAQENHALNRVSRISLQRRNFLLLQTLLIET